MTQRLARVFSHPPSHSALERFFEGLASNGVSTPFATVQRRPLVKEYANASDGVGGFGRQQGIVGVGADYLP